MGEEYVDGYYCLRSDFEVVLKTSRLNAGLDHLFKITNGEEPSNLEDKFLDAQLFSVHIVDEYFADIIEFLVQYLHQRNLILCRIKRWCSDL